MSFGFLSEMTAMPIHGGGVTLRRILGEDLGKFDWLAETIRYSHESVPGYGKARSHSYPWWPIEQRLRPFLGCDRSYRIARHPMMLQAFAKSVASRLLRDEPSIHESRALVCPQGAISLWVTEELRLKAGLRYISWMMDDHLLRWHEGRWVYPLGIERLMGGHLAHAEQVFVISPVMSEFYEKRFGVHSEVLCSPARASNGLKIEVQSTSVLRLVYFGSLGRWQNDAISLLAPMIQSGNVTLDIYTRNADEVPRVLMDAGAILREGIAEDMVQSTAAAYDVMVLPISFLPELRNMSYFNIATKFAECLAAQIPTLLIGPEDSAMVKIAREGSACFVVDGSYPELIKDTFDRLRNPEIRQSVKLAERALLENHFSFQIMQERWAVARKLLLR